MTHIWVPNKEIFCPLCDEPFSQLKARYQGRDIIAYICREDKIFIFAFDPAFNKWRDTDKTIPCANCNYKSVRWFLRYLDDYFQSVCPECGVVSKSDTQASFNKKGLIELDDFIQNQAQDMGEIKIPIKMLKMPPDKLAQLKQRLSQKGQQG